MNIYIDLNECKGNMMETIAAIGKVNIEINIDEGYNIKELQNLKTSLQEVLNKQLPKCIDLS